MNKRSVLLSTTVAAVALFLLLGMTPVAAQAAPAVTSSPLDVSAPLIENVGQFPAEVRFQMRAGNSTLWLTDDAIWVTFLTSSEQGLNLKLSFPGATARPRLEPFDRLDAHISYFIGADPIGWRPDVPAWGGVRYVGLYPGVDLEVCGEDGRLAWRLIGDAADRVRMRVEGADALTLDNDALRVATSAGEFALPLFVRTAAEGQKTPAMSAQPEVISDEIVAPLVTARGAPRPAAVSATGLVYSTFLGGGGDDNNGAIAVDSTGAAYVVGYTASANFPTTPGVFDTSQNGSNDVFVVKLNSSGGSLAYATFIGGSASDEGFGIALDANGNAYVGGHTYSTNFPTTAGAFDTSQNGQDDAFVLKLNPSGTALTYSTVIGGSSRDWASLIAINASGEAYVLGTTIGSGFPTTAGAYQTSARGGWDVFALKLAANGGSLLYSTFIGGGDDDYGSVVALDSAGSAYLSGWTCSSDFPTTAGAYDRTFGGCSYSSGGDAFVTKLNTTGTALAYSTYLGGSNYDAGGQAIVVNTSGEVYLAGYTRSGDFPLTAGAYDTTPNGAEDATLVKLNASGSSLLFGTLLGGSGFDAIWGLRVDGNLVFLSGATSSADFPTTTDAFDRTYAGGTCGSFACRDVFVSKLDLSTNQLQYSTYLGGGNDDYQNAHALAVDGSGVMYVAGWTKSSDFPTTVGAYDTSHNGGADVFVTKLGEAGAGWTRVFPATTPPIRSFYAMAYDSDRGRTLIFGGVGASGSECYGETWEYDGTTWTRVATTGPSPRNSANMVYDTTRHQIILFGGYTGCNSHNPSNDTWAYNPSTRVWSQLTPATAPSIRGDFQFAYDSFRQVAVLFGGWNDYSYLSDTWEFNGTNWQQRSPAHAPVGMSGGAFAYDAGRRKAVLMGGFCILYCDPGVRSEMWQYDGSDWSLVANTTPIGQNNAAAMAYDSQRQKLLLFGGSTPAGLTNRTWEYDGTTWTLLGLSTAPTARYGHQMVYDAARARMMTYGGYDGTGNLNDTWEYVRQSEATPVFVDIGAGLPGTAIGSVTWGDYNRDGNRDLLITGQDATGALMTRIYRNSGSGAFTNLGVSLPGIYAGEAVWGDYDNDGNLDIALTGSTTTSGSTNPITRIYRNGGNETFADANVALGAYFASALGWADYNRDGNLDLAVNGRDGSEKSAIYRNGGSGAFTDIGAGLYGLMYGALAWGDYDRDGDPDLLITGWNYEPYGGVSRLYRNDAGIFQQVSVPFTGVFESAVAWGDYDGDGDLDVALAGCTSEYCNSLARATIYRNDGSGTFVNINAPLPTLGLGALAWIDYDLDSDLDLILSGCTTYSNSNCTTKSTQIFRNDGRNTFTLVTSNLVGVGWSALAVGDYDNDGDPDLALNGKDASGQPVTKIYRNDTTTPVTYSISGRVTDGSSNPIAGVTISDGAGHTVTTDASGNYTITGLTTGTYTLTPSKSGYTFSPASRAVAVPPSATGQNFTGTAITYSISGRVTDGSSNPVSGVTLSDGAGHTATSQASGNYTLSGLGAGTYIVTPSKSGCTFSPTSRSVTVGPDQTGVNFTASCPAPTYSISGQVTGSSSDGLTLSDGAGHTVTADAGGNYVFSGLAGGTYTVTPSKPTCTFSPTSRTITVPPSATGQDFTATCGTPPVTRVKILPATKRANLTGTFTVTLWVENVTNLAAFQTELTYTTSIVQVTAVTLGAFVGSTGRTVSPVGPTIDNTAGRVTFGAFSFGSAAGPNGSGTLAVITFQPRAVGTTALHLQNLGLADPSGNTIPATTEDGQAQITNCFGDFDGDNDVDIFDLQRAASHWNCRTGDACYDAQYDTEPDGDIDVFDLQRFAAAWGTTCATKSGRQSSRPAWSLAALPETSANANLSLLPATRQVAPGAVFTQTVAVQDAANLGAFQTTLTFDPAVAQVEGVTLGSFLGSTGRTAVPVGPTIDNAAGQVTFGAFTFGSQPGVSGAGELAYVRFRAVAAGQTSLAFQNAGLSDPQGNALPLGSQAGAEVTVGTQANLMLLPATQTATVGREFVVTLRVSEAANLAAFQATVAYNPAVAQATGVAFSPF